MNLSVEQSPGGPRTKVPVRPQRQRCAMGSAKPDQNIAPFLTSVPKTNNRPPHQSEADQVTAKLTTRARVSSYRPSVVAMSCRSTTDTRGKKNKTNVREFSDSNAGNDATENMLALRPDKSATTHGEAGGARVANSKPIATPARTQLGDGTSSPEIPIRGRELHCIPSAANSSYPARFLARSCHDPNRSAMDAKSRVISAARDVRRLSPNSTRRVLLDARTPKPQRPAENALRLNSPSAQTPANRSPALPDNP